MSHPYFIINKVSGCPDLNHEHDGCPEYRVTQLNWVGSDLAC